MAETVKLPVFEVDFNEYFEIGGVYAVGMVDRPAIEAGWVALSEDKSKIELKAPDAEKRIVYGPLMIPDQEIFRSDGWGGFWYIKFTKETIEKAARNLLKNGAGSNVNHMHLDKLKGLHISEIWVSADSEKDKSVVLGLTPQPAGTLFLGMAVDDENYWQEYIKTGVLTGFSLEGFFNIQNLDRFEDIAFAAQSYEGEWLVEEGKLSINKLGDNWQVKLADLNGVNYKNATGVYENDKFSFVVKNGLLLEVQKKDLTQLSTVKSDETALLNEDSEKNNLNLMDLFTENGSIITVDDETLRADVYDANGAVIGYIEFFEGETADGEPAEVPAEDSVEEAAQLKGVNLKAAVKKAQKNDTSEVAKLKEELNSLKILMNEQIKTMKSLGQAKTVELESVERTPGKKEEKNTTQSVEDYIRSKWATK